MLPAMWSSVCSEWRGEPDVRRIRNRNRVPRLLIVCINDESVSRSSDAQPNAEYECLQSCGSSSESIEHNSLIDTIQEPGGSAL